jgi:hypothetical protein
MSSTLSCVDFNGLVCYNTVIMEDTGEKIWNGVMDARMKTCWDYYINPKSATFNNATQSSIKAGYSVSYADRITAQDWFKEKKRRLGLLSKAEKVFEKTLDMVTLDIEGNEQADLLRVQTDVAKFIAKTQGKDDGYSERNEMTGANGEQIVFLPVELMDKYKLKQQEDASS